MKQLIVLISFLIAVTAYAETNFIPVDLVGTWLNSDVSTEGLTKLSAVTKDNYISIRAYGKCHPTDCDWGEIAISSDSNVPIVAVFESRLSTRKLIINFLSKSSIDVRAITTFKNRSDSDYEASYYMLLNQNEVIR